MEKTPNLDYNKEFEEQLLIGEDLEKFKAKKFVNLLSDLFFKYEEQIQRNLTTTNLQGGEQ
ncbi:hypothetical protein [Oceanobacillus kimchii]|uniref:hypothetical protein n=1 Tax=Oceanobacillus kimchii TaxID=746691 RepID=UPI003B011360